ncbi:hypothetical protein RB195_008038 [Necator americanus]|uniref:Copper transport protein n=1 Tax=Necator americanus TaxID=51031 RepID=A0ABR1C048_NECAM
MASGNSVLTDVDSFLQEMANSSVSHSLDHHSLPEHHDHHDHSMHSSHATHGTHGEHEGHMMKMWFHGGCSEVILFDFWRIDSISGLVFSFIAIFVMGAMYEGIKWFRVYLQMDNTMANFAAPKENGISLQSVVHDKAPLHNDVVRSSSNEDVYNPTTTPPSHAIRSHNRHTSPYSASSPCSSKRLIQAALYVLQLVLAYWLMLIVMTYNTWLTIAVVLGAGFGHWLFAVLKFRDPAGETADSFATDACH